MKNKQTKALSLSLSANHIRLIKDTFFAITKIPVKFFDKIQIVGNNTQKNKTGKWLRSPAYDTNHSLM